MNAGADPGDPETWNGYAYVRNNPESLVDPSGMFLDWLSDIWRTISGWFGGGGTVSCDPNVPCFSVTGTATSLPSSGGGGGYGSVLIPIVAPTILPTDTGGSGGGGGTYSITKFGVGDISSVSTPTSSTPSGIVRPSNLPPGTPQQYWAPFVQGFNTAQKQLQKKTCGAFYSGQGPATMNATEYRFLQLSSPTTGAQTNSATSVFINSRGPYMTYAPTIGQPSPFGVYWTQPLFRAFILLHELGHQLSSITGFQEDAGSARLRLNQAQSRRVISACF